MFHIDQLIRSRRVIRDVTYRWIPFLFVVLTVVVSTTLLSTSGHPPRGIVVTFGVFACLLVVILLACHLMMYCTRIKHEMDTERAKGRKDDDDPNVNIPQGFIPEHSVGPQAQQPRRERPAAHGPGGDEQHRQSETRPNIRISSYAPSPLSQVAGYGADQPQPQSNAENRATQQNTPQAPDQTPRDSHFRHSSAVVAPLRPTRPQNFQAASTQHRPRRSLRPGGSPLLRRSLSRDTSGEEYYTTILHSTRTSPRTDTAQPSPQDTPRQSHQSAAGRAEPQQGPGRGIPDYRPRDTATAELWSPGPRESRYGISAFTNLPGPPQARSRSGRAGTADSALHARLALLGGPDVWGLVSRFLPDVKPGARLRRRMSADDCLRRPPWGAEDDAEVMVVRDVGCKVVQVVHPVAPEPERVQSLKGSVRDLRVRDSNDSGYHSAGDVQQQPSLSQAWDSLTTYSATSVSSPGSSGGRISSSSSEVSELFSLRPRSGSSMVSTWLGWQGRASMGDDGVIRVMTGVRVRRERQRPLGRSTSC